MVTAGARASVLDRVLIEAGLIRATTKPRPPRLADLPGALRSEVLGLYRQLGGKLDEPLLRPGAWDLPYSDVIVELDEDMHFNRYRTLTLEAPFAASLPWAATYRQHAGAHEGRAGTGGRRWTSPPPPGRAHVRASRREVGVRPRRGSTMEATSAVRRGQGCCGRGWTCPAGAHLDLRRCGRNPHGGRSSWSRDDCAGLAPTVR